jgi:protein gp37
MTMQKSPIQWTDYTTNPIRAKRVDGQHRIPGHFCQKISPGCANCYASRMQPRFGLHQFPGVGKSPAEMGVEVFLDEKVLQKILRHRGPGKVFWCDMSDMFGDWVPFEIIDKCFAVMALTPHLTHQILTKRPERMAEYLNSKDSPLDRDRWDIISEHAAHIGKIIWDPRGSDDNNYWNVCGHKKGDAANRRRAPGWPLPNVWLGTSVENQKCADERIPHLLKCPAAVRFLSCEPLLEAVNLDVSRTPGAAAEEITEDDDALGPPLGGADGIDWVIIGGESGSKARPFDVAWARSLIKQCRAAGVACFIKQYGARAFDGGGRDRHWTITSHDRKAGRVDSVTSDDGKPPLETRPLLKLKDSHGGVMEEWPAGLRVRQFPATAKDCCRCPDRGVPPGVNGCQCDCHDAVEGDF